MSFLTEYFDEYRQHPIRKTKICPENRWASLDGEWLDPKVGIKSKTWTDEEIEQFIKATMRRLRGQSTYYNDYCSHLSPEFKTRPFKPRIKKLRPCTEAEEKKEDAEELVSQGQKLAMKDTELMKMAKEMYDREKDKPTLKPLPTHFRILGYVRPCYYNTGLSEYQGSIARLAYELVRDGRIPLYHVHNGCRPRWGFPPEDRQPELDVVPFKEERLY